VLLRKAFVIITGLFIVDCLGDLTGLIMHVAYKSDSSTTKSIIYNSTTIQIIPLHINI